MKIRAAIWCCCDAFTFTHLTDAFTQNDLQSIQAIHFYCQYVCSLGIEPTTFALLTQCSITEPHKHIYQPASKYCVQAALVYFNTATTIIVLWNSLLSFSSSVKLSQVTFYQQLQNRAQEINQAARQEKLTLFNHINAAAKDALL